MYSNVEYESTGQLCLQKPNVHNSTLLKNTYEVSLLQGAWRRPYPLKCSRSGQFGHAIPLNPPLKLE